LLHPKEWEKVLDTNQKKPQSTPELDYHCGEIGARARARAQAQAHPRARAQAHPWAQNRTQGLHEIRLGTFV